MSESHALRSQFLFMLVRGGKDRRRRIAVRKTFHHSEPHQFTKHIVNFDKRPLPRKSPMENPEFTSKVRQKPVTSEGRI